MTERTPSSRRMLAALAAASTLLLLPACDANEAESGGESAEVSNETLASMVADADGFSIAAGSLTDAGLATVFDGAAAYTVFLPQDAAFEKLGAAGEELRTAEQRPAEQQDRDRRHRGAGEQERQEVEEPRGCGG